MDYLRSVAASLDRMYAAMQPRPPESRECSACDGAGRVIVRHPRYGHSDCPFDFEREENCERCGGTGEIEEECDE